MAAAIVNRKPTTALTDQQGPEHEQQQDQRESDDERDEAGKRGGELVGDVDVDRRGARYEDRDGAMALFAAEGWQTYSAGR